MARLDLKKVLSPELQEELESWAAEKETSPANLAARIIRGELITRQERRESHKIGIALNMRKTEWGKNRHVHKPEGSPQPAEVEGG